MIEGALIEEVLTIEIAVLAQLFAALKATVGVACTVMFTNAESLQPLLVIPSNSTGYTPSFGKILLAVKLVLSGILSLLKSQNQLVSELGGATELLLMKLENKPLQTGFAVNEIKGFGKMLTVFVSVPLQPTLAKANKLTV